MRYILFIFCLIVISITTLSQDTSIVISYRSNQSVLDKKQISGIAKTLSDLQDTIKLINITGHTDDLASDEYNFQLSSKRVFEIYKLLLGIGFMDSNIEVMARGESQPICKAFTYKCREKNRRTELVITYKDSSDYTYYEPITFEVKKDTCKGDTVIVLPNKTRVTYDKCEIIHFSKDCFQLVEINKVDNLKYQSLITTTLTNQPIIMAGMIMVKFRNDSCRIVPSKLQIPIDSECFYLSNSYLYYYNADAKGWTTTVKTYNQVEIDGKSFVEFNFSGDEPYLQNSFIIGCGSTTPTLYSKVKIKDKGYSINEVRLVYDCPLMSFYGNPIKNKINKYKVFAPCAKVEPLIYANVTGPNGTTYILDYVEINTLNRKAWGRKDCKKKSVYKKIFIFPFKDRVVHSKYFISATDLIPENAE